MEQKRKEPQVLGFTYLGTPQEQIGFVDRTQGSLDIVSPAFLDVGEGGQLQVGISPEFVQAMKAENIRVVPLLSNHWNRQNGIDFLQKYQENAQLVARLIQDNGLDGVMVDLENQTHDQREQYSNFVRALNQQLPDKIVSVAIAPNPSGWTSGWHGSYDYARLANNTDFLYLMAYDESYEGGPPGPAASLGWVENSLRYALRNIPSHRLMLGVPFFGRLWGPTAELRGLGISMPAIQQLVEAYGGTVEFDEGARVPHATFTIPEEGEPQSLQGQTLVPGDYQIWFEDERSIREKLALVREYDLMGAGFWSLGQEDPDLWNHINHWITGKSMTRPAQPAPPPEAPRAIPAQTVIPSQSVAPPEQQMMPPGQQPMMPPGQRPMMPPGQQPMMPPGQQSMMPPGQRPMMPPGQQPMMPPGQQPMMPPGQQPMMPPVQQPMMPPGQQPMMPPGQQPMMPPGQQPMMPSNQQPMMPSGQQPMMPLGQQPMMPPGQQPMMPPGQQPMMPPGQRPMMPSGQQPMMPPGQQSMMPPGQRPMMPPGQQPMMPPGQQSMMPPGQQPMMPPGQQSMMPPGQQPMMPPGQQPMMPPGQRPMMPSGQQPMMPPGQQPMMPPGQRPMMPSGQRQMMPPSQQQMMPPDLQPMMPPGQQPMMSLDQPMTSTGPEDPAQNPSALEVPLIQPWSSVAVPQPGALNNPAPEREATFPSIGSILPVPEVTPDLPPCPLEEMGAIPLEGLEQPIANRIPQTPPRPAAPPPVAPFIQQPIEFFPALPTVAPADPEEEVLVSEEYTMEPPLPPIQPGVVVPPPQRCLPRAYPPEVPAAGQQTPPPSDSRIAGQRASTPPEPAPQPRQGQVTGGGYLNVRTGPSMEEEVITRLREGTHVRVLEERDGWYQIILYNGRVGYVNSAYIQLQE